MRCERIDDVASLDIVFVPGVAFDASGRRIGYGKGFYDKLLAPCKKSSSGPPILCALAFDMQLCATLDAVCELHDIFMDFVFTGLNIVMK